jgi:hypothetical protein
MSSPSTIVTIKCKCGKVIRVRVKSELGVEHIQCWNCKRDIKVAVSVTGTIEAYNWGPDEDPTLRVPYRRDWQSKKKGA